MSHLSYLILSRSERTRTCTRSHTHTSLQSRPFGELPQWRQQSPPNAGALWMGSGCSVQKTCSQLVWLVARGDKQTEHRTEGERERESCCHQRWIQRLNAGVQGDYDEEGACMHALICKSRFSCLGFFFSQSRELKVENCWWSCRRTEALPGLFLRLTPGIVARVSRDGIIPFFAFIQGIPASLPSPLSMVLEG